eukprot:TRINITY_DN6857_c0_g1_i5.p5 TRINITY_DN6857_c0_g1~~TRINITY_DN6857_c0_g1_i5.p5  ORF type:complete len:116 (+),score=2.87 TRINITY_DN6857_c0_g1_i5:655-1002(+)
MSHSCKFYFFNFLVKTQILKSLHISLSSNFVVLIFSKTTRHILGMSLFKICSQSINLEEFYVVYGLFFFIPQKNHTLSIYRTLIQRKFRFTEQKVGPNKKFCSVFDLQNTEHPKI